MSVEPKMFNVPNESIQCNLIAINKKRRIKIK